MIHMAQAFVAGALMTGCVAGSRQARLPDPAPLGRELATVGRMSGDSGDGTRAAAPTPTEAIALSEALALALARSPELEAFSHAARAAEARVLQAGRLPNPRLHIEVEEHDRGGEGFGSAECAIALGQVLELGGKRGSRRRAARAESELAGWDYESKRLDVLTETARRFVVAVAAQRRLELAVSALDLAGKTAMTVDERVKAGKESPLRSRRAATEHEMARMEHFQAETDVAVSHQTLAAMWGGESAHFRTVRGDLEGALDAIPDLSALRARLPVCPELARWDAELDMREAAVAAGRAARMPDLEAQAGFRRFEEDGTDAFAFGVALPLPILNRNRGNIAAAEHELARARARRRAVETAMSAELAQAHGKLTSAHMRVRTLRSDVVPAVHAAFDAAHEGYSQGKLDFMDVLDAGRSLARARRELIDAWQDYRMAVTRIERLTATGLSTVSREQEERK